MWRRHRGGGKRKINLAEAARLAAMLLKLLPNLLQAVPILPTPKLAAGLPLYQCNCLCSRTTNHIKELIGLMQLLPHHSSMIKQHELALRLVSLCNHTFLSSSRTIQQWKPASDSKRA